MEDFSGPSHTLWHAFCVRPEVHFESQLQDETVLLVLRAHPITLVPWILNGIFILILLGFVNAFASSLFSVQQLFLFNIGIFAFVTAYYWFNFLAWFFNVGLITNKRVLDVDFHAVIYKEVTEAKKEKIEDTTAKQGGYIASLFNFGNVFIQTAGSEVNIEFVNIPRPTDVVKFINAT